MGGTTILIVTTLHGKERCKWVDNGVIALITSSCSAAVTAPSHYYTVTLLHCYTVTLLHCYTVTLLQHLPTTNTVSIAYSREWRTIWELLKIWMYHCIIHQL